MPRFTELQSVGEPITVKSTKHTCSIGELARDFNVTHRALRFYETKGLLGSHRNGARRHYCQADRDQLAKILRAKQLGLSLREIKTLVIGSKDSSPEAPVVTMSKADITSRIEFLRKEQDHIARAIEGLSELLPSAH